MAGESNIAQQVKSGGVDQCAVGHSAKALQLERNPGHFLVSVPKGQDEEALVEIVSL